MILLNIILMNKNTPVVEMDVNSETGRIREVKKEINPDYLPLIVYNKSDKESALQHWMQTRSIPKTRKELNDLLVSAGVETSYALSLRNLGLNLSDQYWFKPKDSELEWKDVNLFQNDFLSEISGKIPFSSKQHSYSPDASSNGDLTKYWIIKNQERYLLKESTAPYYQQAYNEVFASALLKELKLEHVTYTLEEVGTKTFCSCKTFITPDTEYVPALYIKDVRNKLNHENEYRHFLKCMDSLNIPCKKEELDAMLAFDFLINNNDRHYGNFGFIRDVETLQFKGMAPIFDNGNSLWYRELTSAIKLSGQEAKPFRDTHDKQIKLVSAFGRLDLSAMTKEKLTNHANAVFHRNTYMNVERIERIVDGIAFRARQLERMKQKSLSQDLPR